MEHQRTSTCCGNVEVRQTVIERVEIATIIAREAENVSQVRVQSLLARPARAVKLVDLVFVLLEPLHMLSEVRNAPIQVDRAVLKQIPINTIEALWLFGKNCHCSS